MVRGQISDIASGQMDLDQKEIIRLHDEKTGKLMTAPFIVGAILAGVEDNQMIEQLRWFGILLGRAFQVRDDILDFE